MCFLRYGNIFFLVKFVSLGMQYINTLISNTDALYQIFMRLNIFI